MCGYHGWRWNGEGKAICIPQVRSQLTYEYVLTDRIFIINSVRA